MDEREKNLPRWARELIASLREHIQRGNEPLLREISKLRPLNEKLTAERDAYRELLQCAARGGHMTASAVIEVLEQYAMVVKKED